MFDKTLIGKNLNRIREAKGMTIETLAEKSNFTPRSVCNHVKNGISSVDTIFVYCEALGCEPADLFFLQGLEL